MLGARRVSVLFLTAALLPACVPAASSGEGGHADREAAPTTAPLVRLVHGSGMAFESRLASTLPTDARILREDVINGVEDWVRFEVKPDEERLAFDLDIEGVAGLRLFGGVLEMLDAGGAPRMRVIANRVVEEASGAARPLDLAVEGCAVDTDPRVPWGRSIPAPGASTCRLIVKWRGVAYPARVDPIWSAVTTDLAYGHVASAATRLSDGRVFVAGDANYAVASEVFDFTSSTWSTTAVPGSDHQNPTVTLLLDGRVLLTGSATSEIFDPALGTWGTNAMMVQYRVGATATRLFDGRVVVAGGASGAAECFDPLDPGWFPTDPMLGERYKPSAVLLPSGALLVTGGVALGAPVGAELMDPTSLEWTAAANMVQPRAAHASLLLPDGRAALFGGEGTNTIEVYAPVVGQFSPVGYELVTRHADGGAALLPNGRVLVVGGRSQTSSTSGAEIFDPASGFVLSTASMSTPRLDAKAISLPDGRVLVLGVAPGGMAARRSELFTLESNGATCTWGGECASGSCADGVCCDDACIGGCVACSKALKGRGDDGVCAPIAAGTDPDDECAADSPSTCGRTGDCDGVGACEVHPVGTLCAAPSCDGDVASTPACDALATCAPVLTSCAPYRCAGGGCGTTCNGDESCVANAFCLVASGTCETKGEDGSACATPNACASGACVDGRCASANTCADAATFVSADGAAIACAPFACTPTGCAGACTSVLECAPSYVCRSDGRCARASEPVLADGCSVVPGETSGGGALVVAAFVVTAIRRRRS